MQVIDNLCNSEREGLRRVEELAGRSVALHTDDLLKPDSLERIFASWDPEAVIHFAGLKAVGQSVAEPLKYYQNNVAGTLNLLDVMERHDVRILVFSSSATVYGDATHQPIAEDQRLSATNPYGRTKLHVERMLDDLAASDPRWAIAKLRYFNPVGAHASGRIGEDPQGVPNNLLPVIAQVAVGHRERVKVFGGDYPTPDGTGVRDFIHVVDLSSGHLAALDYLVDNGGLHAWNLGTGQGSSVLEVIESFSRIADRDIPYEIVERRTGDVAVSYADPTAARREIGWKSERGLEQMVADTWNWQSQNPIGYKPEQCPAIEDEG